MNLYIPEVFSVGDSRFGAEHRRQGREESVERWTNTVLLLVFLWDLLTK